MKFKLSELQVKFFEGTVKDAQNDVSIWLKRMGKDLDVKHIVHTADSKGHLVIAIYYRTLQAIE